MAVSPVSFQESNITMEELLNGGDIDVTPVKTGAIIQGKVVGFSADAGREFVIVSIGGAKSEGKISTKEFDKKPATGDDIEALIKSIDTDNGLIYLSKKELEKRRGWEVVSESYEKDLPVSAVVTKQTQRGYMVNVSGLPMFLPHSHVGSLTGSSDKARRGGITGNTLMVKILEVDTRKKTGIVSRKSFLEGEDAENWKKLTDTLNIGDVVSGKVVRHIKIGAFIEVMGVLGFLHKSNISWERFSGDFSQKIPIHTEIQVRVLEVDPDNHRLSLGLKQLTDDPWLSVENRFSLNDVVTGTVTFVANYGAFVDLGEGIEGLLHISEMSWTRKVNHAAEIVKKGQELEAIILDINPGEKRIALGLRQLHKNPWEDIRTSMKVGQVMKSVVKDVTHFGAFVRIADEIDGLIRREDINWDEPAPDPKKVLKSGDEVEFKIIEINFEDQKIGCSTRHLLPNPYKELRQKYKRGTIVDGVVSGVVDFGIFVRFEDKFEGLVHLSAMSKEEAAEHKKRFKKGDKLQVVVRSVDPDTRKISLSTRDVQVAVERREIEAYIDKEADQVVATSNPFKNLKEVVSSGA